MMTIVCNIGESKPPHWYYVDKPLMQKCGICLLTDIHHFICVNTNQSSRLFPTTRSIVIKKKDKRQTDTETNQQQYYTR